MLIRKRVTRLAYEGEEGNEGDAGAQEGKVYTKEEFDSHFAGFRRKAEAREKELLAANQQLLKEAESAKQRLSESGGTTEELIAAQSRVEELEQKVLSAEELANRRLKKTESELTQQLEKERERANRNEMQFRQQVERTQFVSAAIEFEAENPEDFAEMLRSRTEWKEVETDDGTDIQPRVTLDELTDDGKPVRMEYTIREAIKRMHEQPERHGYLFKSHKKSGLGGSGNSRVSGSAVTAEQLKNDPALFRKLRKENPALLKQIRTAGAGS